MPENSFGKQFFKHFFITLGIQVFFVIAAGCSLGLTDTVRYYNDLVAAGCIIAAAANISFSVRSGLPKWQKVLLILLMPTNFTFILLYYGLGVKILAIFEKIFGDVQPIKSIYE